MPTATKTRRKATRTKRGRPAADDFPCPFSELPLRLQDHAIDSFRDKGNCYDYDDSEFLQENLGEVLEYEFGLTPEYQTVKCMNGKTRKGNPKIYWDNYRNVEFEVDDFDIDEVLKHARDDEATTKEFGPCYFQLVAKELLVLMAEVVLLEQELGAEFNASYSLTTGKHSDHSRVEWEWDQPCGDLSMNEACQKLFDRIDEALKDYHSVACIRCRQIIEDEEAYHYSDEFIRETLEANEHYEFDSDGDLV